MRYNFWFWDSAVKKSSCHQIIKEAKRIGFKDGTVGDDESSLVNKEIRNCEISWMPRMHTVESILFHRACEANISMGLNLSLFNVIDHVQVAKYDDSVSAFYDCHNDLMSYAAFPGIERKMTAIMFLSDPMEYVGGDLKIENKIFECKKQGTIVVFPSYIPHEVTPVTRGVRYSATCWVAGPAFK